MELSHTRVLVSDFASCFRFYKDVLGFEVTWGNETSGYADFKTSGTGTFSLFDKAEMAQTVGANQLPPSAQVQDRFVLVFTDDNLDELIPILEARGARIVNQPKDLPDWGLRAAHLRDPDGNLIEIHKALATEEWSDELREIAEAPQGAPQEQG